MLEGPLVFVDVDTQRDFLEPNGALYVPGSDAIVDNLSRLTEYARARRIPVLATADAHTEDDVEEIARFGRHCMVGTPGQERVDATAWPGSTVLAPSGRFTLYDGPLPAHITLEKTTFDVFNHALADILVAIYNRGHPTFVVYGVATDYCVRAAVLGLLERGCKVAVVVDAIRAIDVEQEPEVLAEFTGAGAVLTATEAVCGG
jgi:nicotinamidase/pyrazinamidase